MPESAICSSTILLHCSTHEDTVLRLRSRESTVRRSLHRRDQRISSDAWSSTRRSWCRDSAKRMAWLGWCITRNIHPFWRLGRERLPSSAGGERGKSSWSVNSIRIGVICPTNSPYERLRVPDAVQRGAPLGAERCTADPGPPRTVTVPGLQRITSCCAAPGTQKCYA